jgi:DNA polymerase V
VLDITEKYGKNTILRLSDFSEGATAKERNRLIGGHNGE